MERIEANVSTGEIRVITMTAEEIAAIPPAPPAPELTKIYKHDIWARCSEAEAATLDALLKTKTVRLQRLFNDSLSINKNDELYPMLYAACTAALAPGRADIILEATE